ncbi:MAG: hypothetical protein ACREWI_15000, partial [Telluria sp.]
MLTKHKLHHTAAGLLGSFISRNNRSDAFWALGVLYTEALASNKRVELDLLRCRAQPEAPACCLVARTYVAFLRRALAAHGVEPGALAVASVSLAFGLPPVPKPRWDTSLGDPYTCTVSLQATDGRTVTLDHRGQCAPQPSWIMARETAMREAGWTLLNTITQRRQDVHGRWSLEVLRDNNVGEYEVELDLLHERAVPATEINATVARLYAAMLSDMLGEWMTQLGAATVRAQFPASPEAPASFAFVATSLVTPEGRDVWHNTAQRLEAAPAPG